MLEKKLLTLVCAVGILACGACFVPNRSSAPVPTPPPLTIDLTGVKTIRVVVANTSSTNHIDSMNLSKAIAFWINGTRKPLRVAATLNGNGDATLNVNVLSESAVPPQNRNAKWIVSLRVSSALTRHDGQVLWREQDGLYSIAYYFAAVDPPDVWKDKFLRDYATTRLADILLGRMFYNN